MFEKGQKVTIMTEDQIRDIYPIDVPYGLVGSMYKFLGEEVTIFRSNVEDRQDVGGYAVLIKEDNESHLWHSSIIETLIDVTDKVHDTLKGVLCPQ